MIVEYHRPRTLAEAIELLQRKQPRTYPLGGGTAINFKTEEPIAVVDVQALGLDTLEQQGQLLQIGAAVTLQQLIEFPGLPSALGDAVRHQATYNLRHQATVAGTLASADGRSPFGVAMLALDAQLKLIPGERTVSYGDFLALREEFLPGHLITMVTLSLQAKLSYEYVARSPADLPIVCAALARWPSGRLRLALGGWGKTPTLVLDGQGQEGLRLAAQSAFSNAADEWASAEYRSHVAGVLAQRCWQDLGE
ncbi:MAG: FAD binding domain-containing protein [Anaerolineales bacterium]|nr:FAD binding domain-containing protein [Anaerolineales bacterium]MDW8162060.1 FAD binding domain-containing protein [Anaerolineales bacterium]